ncbi:MAG TPA: hypothetical protein VMU67_05360 [Steroidobacteraceae bacterium]|nr:hypothetical protein [Steroidobacteraceae bacterium]
MTNVGMVRKGLGLTALCATLTAVPFLAWAAADASQEVATAATHAEFSAKADTLKMAHEHLHHTLNCLVGPDGKGFDSKAANPCMDMGAGAIPDTADATAKKHLEHIAYLARTALMSKSLVTVHKDAERIAADLKKIGG